MIGNQHHPLLQHGLDQRMTTLLQRQPLLTDQATKGIPSLSRPHRLGNPWLFPGRETFGRRQNGTGFGATDSQHTLQKTAALINHKEHGPLKAGSIFDGGSRKHQVHQLVKMQSAVHGPGDAIQERNILQFGGFFLRQVGQFFHRRQSLHGLSNLFCNEHQHAVRCLVRSQGQGTSINLLEDGENPPGVLLKHKRYRCHSRRQ